MGPQESSNHPSSLNRWGYLNLYNGKSLSGGDVAELHHLLLSTRAQDDRCPAAARELGSSSYRSCNLDHAQVLLSQDLISDNHWLDTGKYLDFRNHISSVTHKTLQERLHLVSKHLPSEVKVPVH
jgi:hypothetical protein